MRANTSDLNTSSILSEASERAGGLTDLGDLPFTEGLERALDSLTNEARLNELGVIIARERLLGHTVNRLQYVNDRKLFPNIAQEKIKSPVFIVGNPRTGTTILHDILAQDPDSRVPNTWECMYPSPPPEKETFYSDPRIAQCQSIYDAIGNQPDGFKAIHPMGAQLGQECILLFADSMVSPLFHNQLRVPSYEDWVDNGADYAGVYEFHYRQLQHLQSRCARDRWVLKTGGHNWALQNLLAQYPDARIVFTHRDPVKSMTSYASLTDQVRRISSDEVDPIEIAADWIPRLAQIANRSVDVREAKISPDAKIYDMFFPNFVEDQFKEIERIYEALDLEMTGEAADGMRRYIQNNPKGVHGVHNYTAEDYGIDPDKVRDQFARYIEYFDLKPE